MSKKINKKLTCGFLFLVILVSSFYFYLCKKNGVYPFGANTIAISDGGQQIIPMYYHLWDFLHGSKSLLFDWYTGFGNNLIGDAVHYGFFSPVNSFLLFVTRDSITNSYVIMQLIRYILIAISMYYCINKVFKNKLPIFITVLIAFYYCFNGYSVHYIIFPMWLDIMALFPLLIVFLTELLKNGKSKIAYTVVLFLTFIIDVNICFMVITFIIFYSFLFVFCLQEKGKRSESIVRMIICSLCASMMAMTVLLPGIRQIMSSDRMNVSFFDAIVNGYKIINYNDNQKWAMGIVPIVPCVIGLFVFFSTKIKNTSKQYKWIFLWMILTIIMLLSIVVEGSDLAWHLGTYVYFPMRFAFMLQFSALMLIASIFDYPLNYSKKGFIFFLVLLLFCLGFSAFAYNKKGNMNWYYCRNSMIVIGAFSSIALLSFYIVKNRMIKYSIQLILIGLCCFFVSIDNFRVTGIYDESQTDSFALPILGIIEDDDVFNRIKNLDDSIQHNYPLVVKRAALSNYLHVVNSQQIDFTRKLGLNQVWTRMSDTGGTVISDSLFHYTTAFGETESQNDLYDFISKDMMGRYNLYQINVTVPLGLIIDQEDIIRELDNNNSIGNQQIFVETLLNDHSLEVTSFDKSDPLHTFNVNHKSIVYFVSYCEGGVTIIVNGKEIKVKDETSNYMGIIEVGQFENENVTIEVISEDQSLDYWSTVGILDLDEYIKTIESLPNYNFSYKVGKNKLNIDMDSIGENQYLYLPIYNDEGWNCIVNGKNVKIQSLFGTLMAIPLEPGENHIHLSFYPSGLKEGGIIGVIGLLIFIEYCYMREKLDKQVFLGKIAKVTLFICTIGLISIIVLLPVIYFTLNFIK